MFKICKNIQNMQNIEHAKHTKYAYRICKKLQDEEDMTHVNGPYSCRKLAFGLKVFECPCQVGCYRDQAVVKLT